jgi:hypothetical protein
MSDIAIVGGQIGPALAGLGDELSQDRPIVQCRRDMHVEARLAQLLI